MPYDSTIRRYSFLWSRHNCVKPPERYHFDSMQEVIPEKIVRGGVGLDLGCGCGWDTSIMAKDNLSVQIVGMDIINEGIKLPSNLKNAIFVRGSALNIPLKDEVCDFIYSFGVLHHILDYKKALLEISRVLKRGSPSFLYLYEDHLDNFLKYVAVKIVSIIRKITVRIPPRILYILSCLLSPVVVILFSYPAKFFKRSKSTYRLYENIPFNFGSSLFSLKGDIYDRFAVPAEIRFSQKALQKIFMESDFTNIQMTKLRATAGWVVWAYKKVS